MVHDQLWPRSVAALWGVEEKGASQRPVHLASSSSKLGQGLSCSQGQIGGWTRDGLALRVTEHRVQYALL